MASIVALSISSSIQLPLLERYRLYNIKRHDVQHPRYCSQYWIRRIRCLDNNLQHIPTTTTDPMAEQVTVVVREVHRKESIPRHHASFTLQLGRKNPSSSKRHFQTKVPSHNGYVYIHSPIIISIPHISPTNSTNVNTSEQPQL